MPPTFDHAAAREAVASGVPIARVAADLGVSYGAVFYALRRPPVNAVGPDGKRKPGRRRGFDHETARQALLAGETIASVAARLGVSNSAVGYVVTPPRLRTRRPRALAAASTAAAVRAGEPMPAVARRLGVAKCTVRRASHPEY